MSYKYAVIEFMPDRTAGETIHIGIELHDMDTKILYKMYTKSVDEIYRRYGFNPTIPIVFAGLNNPPEIEDDKDYLNKKHEKENNGYERIFWSDVRGGIIGDKPHITCEHALKHLYDIFVLIDKSWDTN